MWLKCIVPLWVTLHYKIHDSFPWWQDNRKTTVGMKEERFDCQTDSHHGAILKGIVLQQIKMSKIVPRKCCQLCDARKTVANATTDPWNMLSDMPFNHTKLPLQPGQFVGHHSEWYKCETKSKFPKHVRTLIMCQLCDADSTETARL